jgi:prepilin peptidase CpaA
VFALPAVQIALLATTVCASGFFDFRERRIPNWIVLPSLLLGLMLNGFSHTPGFKDAVLGLLLALVVYVPLYLIRGMGAGDVKLMAAIGAIVGPQNWIVIFLATSLIGGAAALALVMRRGRYYETFFNLSLLIADIFHFRAPYKDSATLDVRNPNALRMPHGVSIACGTLAALTLSHLRVI